jgi:MFS family permease
MTEDRFKPPATEVRDRPRAKRSAVKGLVMGTLADLGGTFVFSVLLSMVFAIFMTAGGRSPQEIQAALAHSDANPLLSGIGLVGGCAFSILGGYVCERVARQGHYRLGVILSCILAAVGLMLSWSSYSLAMLGLLTALTFGSTLLGTRLGLERGALA